MNGNPDKLVWNKEFYIKEKKVKEAKENLVKKLQNILWYDHKGKGCDNDDIWGSLEEFEKELRM